MQTQSRLALHSERLRFSTWQSSDADLLYGLHSDARVKQGYPADMQWDMEATQKRLATYMKEQTDFGYTKWKLCLHDGTFIGRAGWSPWGEMKAEIGYALKPSHWNQGYGLEAANALADWGLTHHPHITFVGFALPGNGRSRRVLEKMGMRFVDYRVLGGHESAYYELGT